MSAATALPPNVVTRALRGVESRQPGALAELWQLVYPWIVQRARILLLTETRRHELGDAEDLAHEAFLKLKPAHVGTCRDRKHLIRIASRAMRQALVDRARQYRVRGPMASLEEMPASAALRVVDLERPLDLALALDALDAANPRAAEVATLHLLGGLRFVEIARVLGMSEAWVRGVWAVAAGWLRPRLSPES